MSANEFDSKVSESRMSGHEKRFRAKYPNTRVAVKSGSYRPHYTVFAGDYPCAEGYTRTDAFREAMRCDEYGLITPDPNEVSAGAQ